MASVEVMAEEIDQTRVTTLIAEDGKKLSMIVCQNCASSIITTPETLALAWENHLKWHNAVMSR